MAQRSDITFTLNVKPFVIVSACQNGFGFIKIILQSIMNVTETLKQQIIAYSVHENGLNDNQVIKQNAADNFNTTT